MSDTIIADSTGAPPRGGAAARVLYISYDGLMEPLGQSQVFAYLRGLSDRHDIVLVSFEKPEDLADRERLARARLEVAQAGIHWYPMRYHRSPSLPATMFDVCAGIGRCVRLHARHRFTLVHARSYVPALMALALKNIFGLPFIFDMRGFWADQRAQSGAWSGQSLAHRGAKWFERRFLLRAGAVVTLTHAAVRVLKNRPDLPPDGIRYRTIPTCVDLDRFRPDDAGSRPSDPSDRFVLGYVGSVRLWYMLDEMLECFRLLLEIKPGARMLIVSRAEHAFIREQAGAAGIPSDCLELVSAAHADVPDQMRRMHAALFLLKPLSALEAAAPTKMAELLACGVPCLATGGIGDVEDILIRERVGVVIHNWTDQERRDAVRRLVALAGEPDIRQRCRDAAGRHFSLADGIDAYNQLYSALSAGAVHA
jgi:glycosyltransferase involved in cell wall biosynthesis